MRERNRKVFKTVRKVAVVGLVGCLLAGGSMDAFAATLKDVFDEHYYADTYPDLKEAFGYDREALWNHFITYGLSENRGMNEFLDIVKYREEYADLEEAFGDDWDAYLNHYLTFGAKEGRDTGTSFNALDYARRYEDLKAAYGEDLLGLWRHYQVFGKTENREARSERVVVAERDAARAAEEARRRQESQKQGYTVREEGDNGAYYIHEYNGLDQKIKTTGYNADGSERYYAEYEYDSAGQLILRTGSDYNADGSLRVFSETEYDSAGNQTRFVHYDRTSNGSGKFKIFVASCAEFDDEGNWIFDVTYTQPDVRVSVNGETVATFSAPGGAMGNISPEDELPDWLEMTFDDEGNQTRVAVRYDGKTYVLFDRDK